MVTSPAPNAPIDNYWLMLNEAKECECYLVIHGSWIKSVEAARKSGAEPAQMDFSTGRSGAPMVADEIKAAFADAWRDRRPVMACGFEKLGEETRKTVVSLMGKTVRRGLLAGMLLDSISGLDLGDDFMAVGLEPKDPETVKAVSGSSAPPAVGAALAKRRSGAVGCKSKPPGP